MPKVIDLHNVSLHRGQEKILDQVNFSADEGRLVALTGGEGKAEILRLLYGVARPNSGMIRVLGADPARPDFKHRSEIILADADHQVMFPASLRELMHIYRQVFLRWDSKVFHRMVGELNFSLDTQYLQLGPAQQRDFRLVLAIASNPKILCSEIPGEPLVKHLKFFTAEGGTVVLALQESSALVTEADQCLRLQGEGLRPLLKKAA